MTSPGSTSGRLKPVPRFSFWLILVACIWQQQRLGILTATRAFVGPLQRRQQRRRPTLNAGTPRHHRNRPQRPRMSSTSSSSSTRRRTTRSHLASNVYSYPTSSSGMNTTGRFIGFDDGACIEGHDLTSFLHQFVEVVAVEALAELNAINENPSSLSSTLSSSIAASSSATTATTTAALPPASGASAGATSNRSPLEFDADIELQDTSSVMTLFPDKWSFRVRRLTVSDNDDNNNAIEVITSNPSSPTSEAAIGAVWRARLLLVAASALYGTNFALVKLMGDIMPVAISTPLRFGMAAVAALPWLIEKTELLDETNSNINGSNARNAAVLGFEVGLWNAMGHVAQAVGLETTLASKSAFICSMAVVVVPLIDSLAGKRILPRQWVGVTMAVVGVALLELGGDGGIAEAISSLTVGDALSFVQPVMFGIGFSRMERAMHLYPEQARRMTAAQLLAIFMASLVYGLWWAAGSGGNPDGSDTVLTVVNTLQSYPWQQWLTDPSILLSLFWTGCVATALTIYMENMALESLSAAETTLIFSTEPLWGTAFAAAIMGEELGLNAGVGAFFILTACLYSNLGMEGLKRVLFSVFFLGKKSTQQQVASSKQQELPPSKKSFWSSLQKKKGWLWLSTGLASSLDTLVSDVQPKEGNEIVDELMESLLDKMS